MDLTATARGAATGPDCPAWSAAIQSLAPGAGDADGLVWTGGAGGGVHA